MSDFKVGDVVILLIGGSTWRDFCNRPGKITEIEPTSIGIEFLDDKTWVRHRFKTGPVMSHEVYQSEVGRELTKTVSLD